MTKLVPIPSTSLAECWPRIGHMVAVLAEGSHNKFMTGDIINAISTRDMQLWCVVNDANEIIGVATSEIAQFPRKKVSRLIGATGNHPELWIELMPEIERWAKHLGCAANEAITRPGWEKLLAPIGYKKTHVLLERELT